MPGKKMKSIKNPKAYEKLREKGLSKEKAAKFSNAQAGKSRKGGKKR